MFSGLALGDSVDTWLPDADGDVEFTGLTLDGLVLDDSPLFGQKSDDGVSAPHKQQGENRGVAVPGPTFGYLDNGADSYLHKPDVEMVPAEAVGKDTSIDFFDDIKNPEPGFGAFVYDNILRPRRNDKYRVKKSSPRPKRYSRPSTWGSLLHKFAGTVKLPASIITLL